MKVKERRQMPELGALVTVLPQHLAGLESCSVVAEVAWVHPERRYYIAQWVNVRGASFREGFME